jgi:hypothetical protein
MNHFLKWNEKGWHLNFHHFIEHFNLRIISQLRLPSCFLWEKLMRLIHWGNYYWDFLD